MSSSVPAQELSYDYISQNWKRLSQGQREEIVDYLRDKLFERFVVETDFSRFAPRYKDNNYKENRRMFKNKQTTAEDRKVKPFYYKKILVAYGIRYFDDKNHIYYYDALGRLRYADVLDKPFDEFPSVAYQYNDFGELIGVVYNVSEDDYYVFKANSVFYGRWNKKKYYDINGKAIIIRDMDD